MTRFALLLLLLLPLVARGQDVISVSKMPSPDQVASAKDVIDKSKTEPVYLKANGYALANIDFPRKLKCYPVQGSDDCLKFLPLPKGTTYEGLLVNNVTGELTWTRIEPDKDKDRTLVIGIKQGAATILWIANGATLDEEPVIVKAYHFVVGKPAPKPDDPPVIIPDDPLTQKLRVAANADYLAGKADKKILLPLAGIYEGAAGGVFPASVVTVGDLDNLLYQARLAAKLPEPDVVYPTMRKTIQQEIYAKLGIDLNSGSEVLTEDTKRLAKAAFGQIAVALENLAK